MENTYTLYLYRMRSRLPRRLIVGLASGAAVALLLPHSSIGASGSLWWGAMWGLLLAGTLAPLRSWDLLLVSTLYGMTFPTLVLWYLVAPLHGQPVALQGDVRAMASALAMNAAWGFGTGVGLALFAEHRILAGRNRRR